MAEFGINATQLSAPQGAGANVVQAAAPVDYSGAIRGIGNIFLKGIEQNREQKAKEAVTPDRGPHDRPDHPAGRAL